MRQEKRGQYIQAVICLVLTLCTCQALSAAMGLKSAQEVLEHGYTMLMQAHQAGDDAAREQLLSTAIDVFKDAYQYSSHSTKVQALLGAAQSYLLVRAPQRVFPFLWQATPLQRAVKSLQQALVLHPENAAATLLLGFVYAQQARTFGSQPEDARQRRDTYLAQAAALGIPVRRQTAPPPHLGIPPLGVEDYLLFLRYIDARGRGSPDDLLLVYRPATVQTLCYGVVVIAGTSYPLMSDTSSGAMIHAPLPVLTLVPQPHQSPVITAQAQHNGQQTTARFVWNGSAFVALAEAEDKP